MPSLLPLQYLPCFYSSTKFYIQELFQPSIFVSLSCKQVSQLVGDPLSTIFILTALAVCVHADHINAHILSAGIPSKHKVMYTLIFSIDDVTIASQSMTEHMKHIRKAEGSWTVINTILQLRKLSVCG